MSRILHVDRGCYYRRGQALKGIENCAFAWVEEGVSIRNLTLAESIVARNEQANMREPLPYAELPHLRYEPAKRNEKQHFAGNELVWAAHKYAREATV